MSSPADKNLSQAAQDKISSITQQAQSGAISWAEANRQANEVRSSEGANYTVSAGGTTSYNDGSSISSYKTGSQVTGDSGSSAASTMGYHYNPSRNVISEAERAVTTGGSGNDPSAVNGWGYLNTGTGTMDKVQVVNGQLQGGSLGVGLGYVTIGGQAYKVEGDRLTPIENRQYAQGLAESTESRAAQQNADAAAWYQDFLKNGPDPSGAVWTPARAGGTAVSSSTRTPSAVGSGAAEPAVREPGQYGVSNYEKYIRDMAQANIDAHKAAMNNAYQQNMADSRALDDLIAQNYANQKNQAAAANELERMRMNELGAAQGLNTGTFGQLAMSNSAAYQRDLASLGAQEAQSLSDNALARQKLKIDFDNAMVQAEAEGNADLAKAILEEYIRQDNALIAAQQAAQQQSNWQAQFDYQQQQDARNSASAVAWAAMQQGKVPDLPTLQAAGIPLETAQQIAASYQNQLDLETAYKQVQIGKMGSGSSKGSSPGGTPSATLPNIAGDTPLKDTLGTIPNGGATLPSYQEILAGSESGQYGPEYGLVLGNVQALYSRGATESEISAYLSSMRDANKISAAGLSTILQALGQ